MKVSIVIPVYNVESYLHECLDSVIGQTYHDWEVLLIDDGSTDSSGNICDEYAAQYENIRVVHQKNGGLSDARNTGLNYSSGEYIYFLDSDDYIVPEAIEHLVDNIERNQADFVFFDAFVVFTDCPEDDSVMRYTRRKEYQAKAGRDMLLELLQSDDYRTAVQLMLFRTQYIRDNGLTFMKGILHEDELFTFLAFNINGKVAHCHEELYARRVRPASIMTASGANRRFNSLLMIYWELAERYRLGEIESDAGIQYMIRISKSVLAKYSLLSDSDKEKVYSSLKIWKRRVIRDGGYGDMKLKIKCSTGIRKFVYRLQNKFLGR